MSCREGCLFEFECVCCGGLGVGIETVCRKQQFHAAGRRSALASCALQGTRINTHADTAVGLEQGRALAWRAVQRTEGAREDGMKGRMKGGRREFSREQHFPTVWGVDTWLSHIPQPHGRPSTSTQGRRNETDRNGGSSTGTHGRQGCVCTCVPRVCFYHVFASCTSVKPSNRYSDSHQI